MNKISKFLLAGVAAFSLNAMLSNTFGKSPAPVDPPVPQPDKTPKPPVTKTANPNLELKKGSRGYEVELLQKKLAITADGVFGSGTESALFSATGVKSISLSRFESVRAAYQAALTKAQIKAKYEATFPISKQVIALVNFSASVCVYRNGNWFATDLDGRQLPMADFKKTAQVGAVYSFDYEDPSVVIIALPYQVPHNVYNIPVNQTYNKIRVKASWIK